MEFEVVLLSQVSDEFLVLEGLGSAQLVIEMSNGKHNAQFGAQFKKDSQKSNGIRSTRYSQSDPVTGLQQIQSPDVVEDFARERVHGTIVQPRTA